MVVNIEIERPAETLDQGDRASPCSGFGVTGLAGQMCGLNLDAKKHFPFVFPLM